MSSWTYGGAGDDELYGEDDNDVIYGGPDNDTIEGGSGHDDLFGEAGQDSILGGEGNDILDGGDGIDFIDGGPQLDSPEIIDDKEPGYSKTASGGASWSEGFEDDPFDGVPYHRGHGQPGQPPPTYDYYYDEEVAEGEGTATWKFDYAGTDNVNGIECDVYATWVPPDMPGIKVVDYRVTNESGDTGYVNDLYQGDGPGILLHDHDWWQVPTYGPNVSHQFADNDWLQVQLEVDSYYLTQWACADAAMVLPRWPELDLAADSNNDGTIDVTPHGPDDRVEAGSPGRIVGVNDSENRAEVIVNLDPNGYDLSSSQLQLDFEGDGTLITVWSEPTGGTQIHSGDTWDLGAGDFTKTVYVQGDSNPGTSTMILSLDDWTFSERPVPDKVKISTVAVTDFVVEERGWGEDAQWSYSPDDEVLWASDEHRWTAIYEPASVGPFIQGGYWAYRAWDDPYGEWTTFASQAGDGPAIGSPPPGNWAVSPFLQVGRIVAEMQTAKQKALVKITELEWDGVDPGDGHDNLEKGANPQVCGGGDRIFAERNNPPDKPNHQVHDKVKVKVHITPAIPAGDSGTFHLRVFDPDNHQDGGPNDTPTDGDKNDHDPNSHKPGDNYPNTVGMLPVVADVQLSAGESHKSAEFTIKYKYHQPGNNFIVAAGRSATTLASYRFAADGDTLTVFDRAQGQRVGVSSDEQTPMLTVWRTLWAELDSMVAPDPAPPPAGQGPFDGDGVGNDDVQIDPYEPLISLMTTNMAAACVRAQQLPTATYDVKDGTPFVHNLPIGLFQRNGEPKRDVKSSRDFWVVQLVGGYEAETTSDYDDETAFSLGYDTGNTADAPVFVFQETIRDVAKNRPNTVTQAILEPRVSLHEALHQFFGSHGAPGADEGVMHVTTALENNASDNELTRRQIRLIQQKLYPGKR